MPDLDLSAVPPWSVVVLQGLFKGNYVVDKPLTLKGVGAVIDGGGNGTVVKIATSNVSIRDLVIKNSGRTGLDSGIWIENSRGVVVSNVTLEEVFYPVMIYNSSNVYIGNSKISSFRNTPPASYQAAGGVVAHELTQFFIGHGVYVWYSNNVTVAHNLLTSTLDGVYCDHAYNLTVVGNTFFNGSRYGVHMMYCADVRIFNNTVNDYVVGFIPMYSQKVYIFGNKVLNIRRVGGAGIVIFESDNVFVRNNTLVKNYLAIDFYRSPFNPWGRVEITGNVIAYNNIGMRLDMISSPYVYGNFFLENIRDVVLLFNNRAVFYNESIKVGNLWEGAPRDTHMIRQRVFDQLLYDYPQLEILAVTPAFSILEFIFGITYPRGGELVDKYPLSVGAPPPYLPLTFMILIIVVVYVWRRPGY
ncbi:NosD domain-containing protein [Pyrobaculum sp.]|uniref:NosD domain-containing protein n=1 Tax=Pyrobaculum sp. TaxID=2004705 RepID=UPI003168D33F